MGVTGIPDEIRHYGGVFKGIPGEPPPKPEIPEPDGPLSAGLAGLHNQAAGAADQFLRSKNDGMGAAGDGLIMVADRMEDIDQQSAADIRRV